LGKYLKKVIGNLAYREMLFYKRALDIQKGVPGREERKRKGTRSGGKW